MRHTLAHLTLLALAGAGCHTVQASGQTAPRSIQPAMAQPPPAQDAPSAAAQYAPPSGGGGGFIGDWTQHSTMLTKYVCTFNGQTVDSPPRVAQHDTLRIRSAGEGQLVAHNARAGCESHLAVSGDRAHNDPSQVCSTPEKTAGGTATVAVSGDHQLRLLDPNRFEETSADAVTITLPAGQIILCTVNGKTTWQRIAAGG